MLIYLLVTLFILNINGLDTILYNLVGSRASLFFISTWKDLQNIVVLYYSVAAVNKKQWEYFGSFESYSIYIIDSFLASLFGRYMNQLCTRQVSEVNFRSHSDPLPLAGLIPSSWY